MSAAPRGATGNCSLPRAELITDIRVQATGPSDRPAYADPMSHHMVDDVKNSIDMSLDWNRREYYSDDTSQYASPVFNGVHSHYDDTYLLAVHEKMAVLIIDAEILFDILGLVDGDSYQLHRNAQLVSTSECGLRSADQRAVLQGEPYPKPPTAVTVFRSTYVPAKVTSDYDDVFRRFLFWLLIN
ncbi:unnamed protein product [Heligmosomoides polygyrus]|uniref:Uncharacterized protein n=1 Tax=Heligmosomoides polygyrus TaxID=6339 RepID=A0A183GFV2_HELPZ|nr:unnamed protein product [Heligmosomoides polygyrus]